MNIGDVFPDFSADTTSGPIDFYEWKGDSWAILFSHPADFTPVCTTELAELVRLAPQFAQKNVKLIALSCDSVESHQKWIADIKCVANSQPDSKFPYPIIDDARNALAISLNMLDRDETMKGGKTTTCRAVFIVDHCRKLRASILYPATTGRNFTEILRIIDSMQLTDEYQVATPVNWNQGEDCMVIPTVSNEHATELFPAGFAVQMVPSGQEYMRMTPCPREDFH